MSDIRDIMYALFRGSKDLEIRTCSIFVVSNIALPELPPYVYSIALYDSNKGMPVGRSKLEYEGLAIGNHPSIPLKALYREVVAPLRGRVSEESYEMATQLIREGLFELINMSEPSDDRRYADALRARIKQDIT